MNFLPDQYVRPASGGGNYLKLHSGQNKVRVLSSVVTGYLYWTTENKPVRSVGHPGNPADARVNEDGSYEKIKHFWALTVWVGSEIKIWEITQSSIQESLAAIAVNPSWGHPKKYDITVDRSGSGLSTKYSVQPSPPSEIPAQAISAWKSAKIDLEELYAGGDPFSPSSQKMGAAGSYGESGALRKLVDGLSRSANAEQLTKWQDWAKSEKQISCIANYAGSEEEARSLVDKLSTGSDASRSSSDGGIPF